MPDAHDTPDPNPDLELVTAWSTFDPAALLVAKSLLDDAGIPYVVGNENFLRVSGYASPLFGWSPAFGEFGIQVSEEDAARAGELLAEIQDQRTMERLPDDSPELR